MRAMRSEKRELQFPEKSLVLPVGSMKNLTLSAVYRARFLLKKWKARHGLDVLKNVIISNLASVFGDSLSERAVLQLARENIRNHGISASFLEFWKYKTRCQKVEWDGYEIFEEVKKRDGAAIVCSIHVGNYYIFPFEIAKKGHETVVVVGDQHRQMELIHIIASSLNLPIKVVSTDGNALFRLIGELKRGKVIYILIDELGGAVNNEKLLKLQFLGRTLQFKRGIGAVHYYSKLPVIPVVSKITGCDSNLIQIAEPVVPCAARVDRESAIDKTVRELFAVFEPFVRNDPAQWQKWIDLRRYEPNPPGITRAFRGADVSPQGPQISMKHLRISRRGKEYILVNMREGRYFVLDKIGCCAVRLMCKRDSFDEIAERLRSKFDLSAGSAARYVREIQRISGE